MMARLVAAAIGFALIISITVTVFGVVIGAAAVGGLIYVGWWVWHQYSGTRSLAGRIRRTHRATAPLVPGRRPTRHLRPIPTGGSMNAHLSFGDVPAWIAIVLSLLALLRNWKSSRWEKQSAEAADKSANEAARANLIAQRALDLEAARGTTATDDEARPDVSWRIEKGDGSLYVLRNTGSAIADHVYVDESRAPQINRRLPSDSVVQPGAGHEMLLAGSWQSPMPTELYVRWAGHDAWVAVPLPR